MNQLERDKIKNQLFDEHWTEELHKGLKKLPSSDARAIVESMTDEEIDSKVNIRQFQGDYIADYLKYLWTLSKPSYWKHLKISLHPKAGFLWGDDLHHLHVMCEYKIPDDVFEAVLHLIATSEDELDLDPMVCVIKAQVENFGRKNEADKYIAKQFPNDIVRIQDRIQKMLNSVCQYH